MKILVLDDDAAVRRSVALMLRKGNFDFVEASCCSDARAVAGCGVGIFDVDLPDGDGVELAKELLSAGRLRSVVFHTGAPDDRAAAVGPVVLKGSSSVLLATVAGAITGATDSAAGGSGRG